jgi:hypothetical protein
MQLFLPATMQGITQEGGTADAVSSPPSAPVVAAETAAEA